MSDNGDKSDKSTWAIGGGVLLGLGVGFFFLGQSALYFVGSIIAGVLLTFLLEYVEVSSNAYNLKQGFGSRPELVPVPDNVT